MIKIILFNNVSFEDNFITDKNNILIDQYICRFNLKENLFQGYMINKEFKGKIK